MPPYAGQSLTLKRQDSLKKSFQPGKTGQLKTLDGDNLQIPVVKGDLESLPDSIQDFIAKYVS